MLRNVTLVPARLTASLSALLSAMLTALLNQLRCSRRLPSVIALLQQGAVLTKLIQCKMGATGLQAQYTQMCLYFVIVSLTLDAVNLNKMCNSYASDFVLSLTETIG